MVYRKAGLRSIADPTTDLDSIEHVNRFHSLLSSDGVSGVIIDPAPPFPLRDFPFCYYATSVTPLMLGSLVCSISEKLVVPQCQAAR
jgi:hypothetical protein